MLPQSWSRKLGNMKLLWFTAAVLILAAASPAKAAEAHVETAITAEAHTEATDYITQILNMKMKIVREAALNYNFTDPSSILLFVVSQIFHAQITDTFPTLPFLNPLNWEFWKLLPCEKKDVAKCLWWGNSTNGLPKQIQGIWWQDGVGLPEEAIGTAGEWNAAEKRLVIHDVRDPVWAYEDSSSVWTGLYWLPSGAAHFNLYSLSQAAVEFSFNEDATFATIGISFYGIPAAFLRWINFFNVWTMQYIPEDNTWYRESALFGVPTKIGEYYFRQIIDGVGDPTDQFPAWLKYTGGKPFMVRKRIFPPS
eukprot:jgi/Botrbrau1/10803/Bobra.0064s0009.1